ncbi:MAG: AAA family ATPase [Planctomycetes bacterium]|nr:AAA family ATPase [Planctomycetota bacterium]
MIDEPILAPPHGGIPAQPPSLPSASTPPGLPILDAALAYHRVGLCVLPTVAGEKRPAGLWKTYEDTRPDEEATAKMFQGAPGICIVCGPVSGNTECIDFDEGGAAFPDWSAVIPKELFDRLVIERSPSGGVHVAYRCPDAPALPTCVLARTEEGRKLIETRGTGAVFLCDPTPGYQLFQGCFTVLPVVTADEREFMLNTAAALNRHVPKSAPVTFGRPASAIPGDGLHPYAVKALAVECATVAQAVESTRNDTLNVAAVKLGHYVGGGLLPEPFVRSELAKAGLSCGLEPTEVAATIESGLKKGMTEPKGIPARAEPPLVDMSALLAKAGSCASATVEPSNPDQTPGWRLSIMTAVEEEPIRWLWPKRIALGKLNMLVGDPGLGKSFITCDLAARVSTGRTWPDEAPSPGAGWVMLLNAEDGEGDTIKPRLRAARADMAKIAVMAAVDHGRLFSLGKHLDELARCAAMLPDLRLIVIDPVTAFMSGIDSHKNSDVREALAPLSELACQTGAAVLAVSHLNKGSGQAVYRATGSLAFIAASRSVWAVAKDRQDRDRRVFLPVKNNLGNDKTGLAYSINGFCDPPFVDWDPSPVEADIDDMLNQDARRPLPRSSATAAVDEWLEAFLGSGEKASTEIYGAGKAAGFSEGQLQRSRKRIGARVKRDGMPSRSFWSLSGDDDNHDAPVAAEASPSPGDRCDCGEWGKWGDLSPQSRQLPQSRQSNGDGDEARRLESAADQPIPAESAIASPSPTFQRLKAAPWLA